MSLQAKKTISLMAVILVASLIFFFSAQPGDDSSQMSNAVTELVLSAMVPGYGGLSESERLPYLEQWGFYVRKTAHFSEFALLAATLVWHLTFAIPEAAPLALAGRAWTLTTLYAGTDELHQMFVDRRGPALTDVGIDSLGALTAVVILAGLLHLLRRRHTQTER